MIRYRPFLNTDPPLISEIWRSQKPIRGQVSTISRLMLDHHVYAKPYFEAAGFIVAVKDGERGDEPIGFVHAGFAVNDDHSDLDPDVGIVCQLKVVPGEHDDEVSSELLRLACDYLIKKGASQIHAGTQFPFAPFYLGLYGGSQIPGVLADDTTFVDTLKVAGFDEVDQIVVHQRELFGFRAVTDRTQLGLRRKYQINAIADPLERSWWESCTLGLAEREQFTVTSKSDQSLCGSVSFWDMQPLANHWGVLARGLYDLKIEEANRGAGMATFLVGESLQHLLQQGVGLVEAQTKASDVAALGVFKKLGFEEVSRGLLMQKMLK